MLRSTTSMDLSHVFISPKMIQPISEPLYLKKYSQTKDWCHSYLQYQFLDRLKFGCRSNMLVWDPKCWFKQILRISAPQERFCDLLFTKRSNQPRISCLTDTKVFLSVFGKQMKVIKHDKLYHYHRKHPPWSLTHNFLTSLSERSRKLFAHM